MQQYMMTLLPNDDHFVVIIVVDNAKMVCQQRSRLPDEALLEVLNPDVSEKQEQQLLIPTLLPLTHYPRRLGRNHFEMETSHHMNNNQKKKGRKLVSNSLRAAPKVHLSDEIQVRLNKIIPDRNLSRKQSSINKGGRRKWTDESSRFHNVIWPSSTNDNEYHHRSEVRSTLPPQMPRRQSSFRDGQKTSSCPELQTTPPKMPRRRSSVHRDAISCPEFHTTTHTATSP